MGLRQEPLNFDWSVEKYLVWTGTVVPLHQVVHF